MADVAANVQPSVPIMDDGDNVVRVQDLHVNFYTTLGVVRALNGVSFNIPRGKVLGVVGESGCGKSITGLSILHLVPRPGKMVSGKILFQDSAPMHVHGLAISEKADKLYASGHGKMVVWSLPS